MDFFAIFVVVTFLYLGWATVLSDVLLHRVWSFALFCLAASTASLWWSILPTHPGFLLFALSLVVSVALSPAQNCLHKPGIEQHKALEIIWPKSDNRDSDSAPQTMLLADVIAVHGLASNPKTTWESGKNSVETSHCTGQNDQPSDASGSKPMWLRDFLPAEGLNARIITFNHNTAWKTNALCKSLQDHGNDLLRVLKRVRDTPEKQSRPLIFIGHSFGGLIVKQALVIANAKKDDFCREICQQTKGVIFLGTPHRGAQITILGKMSSLLGFWKGSSTSLLEVIEPKSTINEGMHDSFMDFVKEHGRVEDIVCVFEAEPESWLGFPVKLVVEKDSAVIDGSQKIGFDRPHRGMQRFNSRDDEKYQEILFWMRKWMEAAQRTEPVPARTLIQQEACLRSLAFPEMDARKHDIKDEASGTCTWLRKNQEYLKWLNQQQKLLWIIGNPGVGKSTLMKFALEEDKQRQPIDKLVLASFFFHGRGADIQRSPLGLFRSLLHQILAQIPDLLSEFSADFEKRCQKEGEAGEKWNWHVAELQKFLKASIPRLSKVYSIRIYIDALDECGDGVARNLVADFQHLISESRSAKTALSICFSCRHYPVVALDDCLTIDVKEKNHHDIAIYTRHELKRRISDDNMRQQLERLIVSMASGVFLWVVLVVPEVLRLSDEGRSMKEIQKVLHKTPQDLNSLYQEILQKINREFSSESLRLMQWICFARWPLSLEEVRVVLVVDANTTYRSLAKCLASSDNYAENHEQIERRVRSLSGGLAEVKQHEDHSVVQFIHQSVNDHLLRSGLQELSGCSRTNVIGSAHFQLSRSCIRYMTMEEILGFEDKHVDARDLESKFPFLRYATINWTAHAEIVEANGIPQGDLLELSFHRFIQSYIRFFRRSVRYGGMFGRGPRSQTTWTLQHIAATYGLRSVLESILDSVNRNSIDLRDKHGRTPLSYAAGSGRTEVVELLADRDDVDADSRDNDNTTPLSWAARRGHEKIVKLLADRDDVDADSKDIYGRAPLWYAVNAGHEKVVEILANRNDVDINSKDELGKSPLSLANKLWYAVNAGHEEVVEILANRNDVDINSKDKLKDKLEESPLSLANKLESRRIQEILRARNHQPDPDTTTTKTKAWDHTNPTKPPDDEEGEEGEAGEVCEEEEEEEEE